MTKIVIEIECNDKNIDSKRLWQSTEFIIENGFLDYSTLNVTCKLKEKGK